MSNSKRLREEEYKLISQLAWEAELEKRQKSTEFAVENIRSSVARFAEDARLQMEQSIADYQKKADEQEKKAKNDLQQWADNVMTPKMEDEKLLSDRVDQITRFMRISKREKTLTLLQVGDLELVQRICQQFEEVPYVVGRHQIMGYPELIVCPNRATLLSIANGSFKMTIANRIEIPEAVPLFSRKSKLIDKK